MRQYKTEEIKVTDTVICNSCKKKIKYQNGHSGEGVFSVDYVWEYGSTKDGERHSFDLCEECYDKIVREFAIPAEVQG